MTPYAAAKIVNAALKEAGLNRSIPPQMIYNYSAAKIAAGKKPIINAALVDGKWKIDEVSFTEWMTKYLEKNGVKVENTESTEIEGQLALEV